MEGSPDESLRTGRGPLDGAVKVTYNFPYELRQPVQPLQDAFYGPKNDLPPVLIVICGLLADLILAGSRGCQKSTLLRDVGRPWRLDADTAGRGLCAAVLSEGPQRAGEESRLAGHAGCHARVTLGSRYEFCPVGR